jgi:tight adherence protein C
MAERIDLEELNIFVRAVGQADALGIPIAQVLRVQAREMRIKRSQRAEEAAQKVPVKILFPLIFCILPSLFVVVLGPSAVRIYHSFF